MLDTLELDNPIWHSLKSRHELLAGHRGLAARYDARVSPLAGMQDLEREAFNDLLLLVRPLESVALFTVAEPILPPGWRVVRHRMLEQMVLDRLVPFVSDEIIPLTAADVPEMLALVAETKPGPFEVETITMGRYTAIKPDGRGIASMAGERLSLDNFCEISAVCTAPQYRGRGYAAALVSSLAARLLGEGRMPILHVTPENGAKAVYEKVGFRYRKTFHLTVLSPTEL